LETNALCGLRRVFRLVACENKSAPLAISMSVFPAARRRKSFFSRGLTYGMLYGRLVIAASQRINAGGNVPSRVEQTIVVNDRTVWLRSIANCSEVNNPFAALKKAVD
jgi:hypothetical protein